MFLIDDWDCHWLPLDETAPYMADLGLFYTDMERFAYRDGAVVDVSGHTGQ